MESWFKTVKIASDVWIPPGCLSDIDRYVSETYNQHLMTYNPKLHGIILSYSQLGITKEVGYAPSDIGLVGLKTEAQLLLFSPLPEHAIPAIVQKITSNGINLLVFGLFNATISMSNIPMYSFHDQTLTRKTDDMYRSLPRTTFPDIITAQSSLKISITSMTSITGLPILEATLNEHAFHSSSLQNEIEEKFAGKAHSLDDVEEKVSAEPKSHPKKHKDNKKDKNHQDNDEKIEKQKRKHSDDDKKHIKEKKEKKTK
ncbi:putative DNA-directed RNA polymerase I subunit RPA43 [Blattamonas nauphoetae]|uniref:DNA-directed RNA polymerase I subunit RPA43 n=1 Tax=Blattamonas nauphoetae TaxID=2049346 RepID=A0ABQ9Y6D5_9EUKA|nr:putative DNA-directed RNA polymerase I subunit RPA43 [Blattamonas nauphoetae]